MRNDDVIQSIRYMLNLDDVEISHILKLRGYKPRRGEIATIFEIDEDKPDADDELMGIFLTG